MLLLFVSLLPCLVLARPQTQQAAQQPQSAAIVDAHQTTPIPIVNAASEVGEDGSFNYSYETGNGIHYQQSAYTKKVPLSADSLHDANNNGSNEQVIQVMTGSFSYPAPDGTIINLTYIADENGFQPQGEHLPTPPPIPESIQKVLATLPQAQNHDENQQNQQNLPPPGATNANH